MLNHSSVFIVVGDVDGVLTASEEPQETAIWKFCDVKLIVVLSESCWNSNVPFVL
jgi:beta-phosphoglucomutase-like phosphatase (HAD superfamily)